MVTARASLAVLAATAAVVCTACGSSASPGAGTGQQGESHSTANTVTIVGTVMQEGGAAGPDSQPPTLPLDADVAAYPRTAGQATYSGSPVAQTHASASNGGRFALQVPPGSYFMVAQSTTARDPSVRTVEASADQKRVTVTLFFNVP
jgi:hypothetical protein